MTDVETAARDVLALPGAVVGDGLWVVNGQLDRMGGTPDLPFTIATIPTPASA